MSLPGYFSHCSARMRHLVQSLCCVPLCVSLLRNFQGRGCGREAAVTAPSLEQSPYVWRESPYTSLFPFSLTQCHTIDNRNLTTLQNMGPGGEGWCTGYMCYTRETYAICRTYSRESEQLLHNHGDGRREAPWSSASPCSSLGPTGRGHEASGRERRRVPATAQTHRF